MSSSLDLDEVSLLMHKGYRSNIVTAVLVDNDDVQRRCEQHSQSCLEVEEARKLLQRGCYDLANVRKKQKKSTFACFKLRPDII